MSVVLCYANRIPMEGGKMLWTVIVVMRGIDASGELSGYRWWRIEKDRIKPSFKEV